MPKQSRQSRGRKRVSRALAKQYRKNEKLIEENESLRRKFNSARKKLNRMDKKQSKQANKVPETPRSKSNKLLRDVGIDPKNAPKLRQKVLFAECITEEIKEARKINNQDIVRHVVTGKVIKKYRLKKALAENTYLDRRKFINRKKSFEIRKRSRNTAISRQITNTIREYLEREDNSRLLPGKADAVKVGSSKVQKRVLNDYMYNLHAKFQAESTVKVSHATFCRRKPISIAHVTFSTRSVCLCQKHQNFALKLRCLKNYKITSPDKFMDIYILNMKTCWE